jgi:hypothetical protein
LFEKPQLKGKNKVVCFVFMNVIFFLLLFFDILYVSILLIKTFQLLWFCHIVDNRPLTFAHSQLYSKIICFIVMAAKSFGIDLTFDYIFNAAKDRGFTRQGEIFSGK